MKRVIGLLAAFAICFSAAAIGSLATRSAPEFYSTLVRPPWAPPASVFGPVWTVLYALMAVALWLVWKERGIAGARTPLALFLIQLALNALWSWLFFAWRHGVAAQIEIVILLAFIVLTILTFWRVRPLAGVLLLPYLAWVAYATALTFALVQRNPGVL
jgi:tryptophan-rich sensory protein